jgi:protein-tyrosine phosphatase
MLLQGQANFRDVGGLPTVDGGTVRSGAVFRSGNLSALTDADLDVLRTLEVRAVCDLRAEHERNRWPSRWPVGSEPRVVTFDVLSDISILDLATLEPMLADPTGGIADEYMVDVYLALADASAPAFRCFVDLILDGDSLPIVVHCTAGKDRTGVMAALLLVALGVSRDLVASEHARSDEFFDQAALVAHFHALGVDPEQEVNPQVIAAMRAKPEHLETALRRLEERHGSIEAFLAEQSGVDAERREALRSILVV